MARYFPESSHAQVLSQHPAFDWQSVVDPDPAALTRARQDWNIDICAADVSELPDAEQITAAVIASPPAGRLAVLEALPSLRVLMVEKPLGGTAEQRDAFMEACKARGITVQVNFWRRAVPSFQKLAEVGLARAVGKVQSVFGLYGNGVLNNGSHLVDFLRMLCGEVESVEGCGQAISALSPVADDCNISCLLRLSSGASAALTPVDFTNWREVGLDIWGTEGRLSILQESLAIYHYPRAKNRGLEDEMEIDSSLGEAVAVDVSSSLSSMYDNLVDAVENGTALLSPATEALQTEAIVQKILATAEMRN